MSKVLKLLLALLILATLVWLTNPQDLVNSLKEVSLLEMTILMLISFSMIAISAYKWQIFLEAHGACVNYLRLCKFYLVGYFINMFLPSYVGGDALRSYYAGKSAGHHQALSATLLERATGLISMLVLAVIAACLRVDLIGFATGKFVIVVSVIVLLSLLILILAGRKYSANLFEYLSRFEILQRFTLTRKVHSHASKFFEVLFSLKAGWKRWLKIFFLSILFHTFTVVNTYYTGIVVGWQTPPIPELFVVLPIILIIGAIPLTPAGLGITEGAFFHYLQLLGASSGQAMAVALVLRAKTFVLAFLGWLVWLEMDRSKMLEASSQK